MDAQPPSFQDGRVHVHPLMRELSPRMMELGLLTATHPPEVKATFMEPMYRGAWTGTIALTEPQTGSSLADVRTRAAPAPDGTWRIQGSKLFISGADQDFSENVVHLTRARGMGGEVERMLRHSADFLDLFGVLAVAWRWLAQAAAAKVALARGAPERDFYEGKLGAAQYWFAVEVPHVPLLAGLCRTAEDSYARMRPEWF